MAVSEIKKMEIMRDWNTFIKSISVEISDLTKDRAGLVHKLTRAKRLHGAMAVNPDDIKPFFEFKDVLIESDPSLQTAFDILEKFEKIGALGNSTARIYAGLIKNSPAIVGLDEYIKKLEEQIDDIDIRKERLWALKDEDSFDIELIDSLMTKQGLDDQTKKNILLYFPVVVNIVMRRTRKDSLKANVISPDSIMETMEIVPDEVEEPTEKSMEIVNDLKGMFETINSSFNGMFIKYEAILNSTSKEEMDKLHLLSFIPEAYRKREIANKYGDNYAILYAKLIMIEVIELRSKIDNYIKDIENGNQSLNSKTGYNYLRDSLERYQELLTQLVNVDKEIIEHNMENNNERTNMYMLLGSDGEVIPSRDVDLNEVLCILIKKGKLERNKKRNDKERGQLVYFVDKDGKEVSKELVVTTYGDNYISYIDIGRFKYILAAFPKTHGGIDSAINLATNIVNRYNSAIYEQISLIEANNLEFIATENGAMERFIKEYHFEDVTMGGR